MVTDEQSAEDLYQRRPEQIGGFVQGSLRGGGGGEGILTFDWVREIADTMPRAKGGWQ